MVGVEWSGDPGETLRKSLKAGTTSREISVQAKERFESKPQHSWSTTMSLIVLLEQEESKL